jgi:hypothetical protein
MGDSVKKILMFSDIEGCQADPEPQSNFLCSNDFYEKLDKMLDPEKGGDPNLNIAFLGDYFDQGLGVFNSIKGMYKLLITHPTRVHVILGNRDVNKLRFMFELKHTPRGLRDDEGWDAWVKNGYYKGLVDTSGNSLAGVPLVNHMLPLSFGAGKKTPDGKMIGLHSFVPDDAKTQDITDETALNYLLAAFGMSEKKPEFLPLDLLSFFSKCKIAHVFNDKVLLAHGGGFYSGSFFNGKYIKTFESNDKITADNYHKKLNEFRVRLASDDDMSEYMTTVKESVDVYNNLLQEVLNEIRESPPRFTWKFVLLQALGLKPNATDNSEDARYKSLIQSCSQDGCKGPNTPLSKGTDSSKLAKILKDSGITHVSYGHKPICFPIPVIYRREEMPNVTFISNDTSNGNRKVEEIGNNTAIGTMVIFGPNDVVQSKIEPIELNGREKKVGNYEEMYKPLTLKTTPVYKELNGAKFLEYGTKKVVFNKSGHDQLKFEDVQPAQEPPSPESSPVAPVASSLPSVSSGGKRRSRHRKQHKSKRGSKRGSKRVSKRTRRNKHHTKRGRKMIKQ